MTYVSMYWQFGTRTSVVWCDCSSPSVQPLYQLAAMTVPAVVRVAAFFCASTTYDRGRVRRKLKRPDLRRCVPEAATMTLIVLVVAAVAVPRQRVRLLEQRELCPQLCH